MANAASVSVAASETTSSTSYTTLPTATAVTVTVGTNGKLLVGLGAPEIGNTVANAFCIMSFVLSGANTLAAADSNSATHQSYAANARGGQFRVVLLTSLNAGSTTVTANFKVQTGGGGAGIGTWVNRNLWALPL